MPIYTDSDLNKITIPTSNGVLTDEAYKLLSPNSYRLDSAISSYKTIREALESDVNSFSSKYDELISTMEECLGTKFFSINNHDLGLFDSEEELAVKNQLIETIISKYDDILANMNSINSKLDEVESALQKLNSNYQQKKGEIEAEWTKYVAYKNQEPQASNYLEKEQYQIAHSSWGYQLRSMREKIDGMETRLKRDAEQTKNSINVNWICSLNGGIY